MTGNEQQEELKKPSTDNGCVVVGSMNDIKQAIRQQQRASAQRVRLAERRQRVQDFGQLYGDIEAVIDERKGQSLADVSRETTMISELETSRHVDELKRVLELRTVTASSLQVESRAAALKKTTNLQRS